MSKKLFSKIFVFLLVVGLLFAVAPTGQAQAADIPVACLGTDDTALLQGAITGANDGDVILVSGTCALTANITVSKDVTLDGRGAAKIQVSGTGDRITMTTAGATLQGFDIEKTDKTGVQNIIYINASNITLANNKIHGQFVIGDSEVSRAFITSGGNTGLSITGNEFWALRQPAYISGVITGTITNNYTHGTKGWVLEQGDLTFTNNTWGTVALGNPNVYDIAILSGVNAAYYTDVPAMSAANNNAFIEDQRYSPARLTPVYVDASAPSCTDCGTARMPYQTIQAGITRVIAGGTVNVAAGAYTENVTINKALSLLGAGDDVVTLTGVEPTTDAGMLNIQASNVTVDGFKLVGAGYKTVRITQPTSNVTFRNNTVVGAQYTSGGGWSLFETNTGAAQTNLTITGNIFENHGSQIGVYINPPQSGLVFTNNTFQGDSTTGPVVGLDGLIGDETVTGNVFNISSSYALLELFGTNYAVDYPILPKFNSNTFPAGYIASKNMVVPASVVYPSTNDNNRTQGWAHVDFVSADAVARTMTFKLVQPRAFFSCVEYRTSAETEPYYTDANYNPYVLDGLYRYTCQSTIGEKTITVTLEPSATYVEFRLAFGAESDERFYWTVVAKPFINLYLPLVLR